MNSSFQQPVPEHQIRELIRHAFGASTSVESALLLSGGKYNTTYRVNLQRKRPVVLRVAPEPQRQYDSERELMRNEYASIPRLKPIADLMPATLFADFSQHLIGRDYVIQSWLDGVPAAEHLSVYPREQQGSFWQDLGSILARVHAVRGSSFGRVLNPAHLHFSAAVHASISAIASDLENSGLDANDVRKIAALALSKQEILGGITDSRLLHGDLWIGNVMIAADTTTPRITGVFDCDRTSWGDPMADWTMHLLERRSTSEQRHFWNGYGEAPPDSEDARIRGHFYRAWGLAEARLEYQRLRQPEKIAANQSAMHEVFALLNGLPS